MNSPKFESLLENRIKNIKQVLSHKALEYATDDDRLHNFKIAARMLGNTPTQAWLGMFIKHFVSIYDLIMYPQKASKELINEKIGDAINYLILLEAIFIDISNGDNNVL